MANDLIPFGKYKGQPVDVLQADPQYMDWLMGQSWFAERYKNIYTVVINNFGEASETPEHNAMQVKFLESEWRTKFAICLLQKKIKGMQDKIQSQQLKRLVDLFNANRLEVINRLCSTQSDEGPRVLLIGVLQSTANLQAKSCYKKMLESARGMINLYRSLPSSFAIGQADLIKVEFYGFDAVIQIDDLVVYCELKPSMGDDYPAVIRQINSNADRAKAYQYNHRTVLIIGQYTGKGATYEQMVSFFAVAGIEVVKESDIDSVNTASALVLYTSEMKDRISRAIILQYEELSRLAKLGKDILEQSDIDQLSEIETTIYGEQNMMAILLEELSV